MSFVSAISLNRGSALALVLVGFSLLAFGCSGRSHLLDYAERSGAQIAAPPSDKALVVFFCRENPWAGFLHGAVYDGERFIATLTSATFTTYLTDPGQHRFMVANQHADFLDADLQGGKIYFVAVFPRSQHVPPGYGFWPISQQGPSWKRLKTWLSASVAVKANEQGLQWARDHEQEMKQIRSKCLPDWEARRDRPVLRSEDGVTSF